MDYLFSLKYSTDLSGTASIAVKVPGTFTGLQQGNDGRYLAKTLIWTRDHVNGDRLSNLKVRDLDGVIPVGLRPIFPAYPIIASFSDPDLTYTGNFYELFIPPQAAVNIGPVDPSKPRFIPSGLYICATFTSGSIIAGREIYINVQWSKD